MRKQLGENFKTLLFQKRDIFPNEAFKKSVLDLRIAEKGTISYIKSGEKITLTFGCYDCSLIYPMLFDNNEEYLYLDGKNGHYYIKCFV